MLPYGRKNPLPFPFSQRSHVGNLRQTNKQKEVGVKRVETLVSTLLPRSGARHVPAVRRRRISSLNLSEKPPARQGRTRQRQFAPPAQPVPKKTAARKGANTPAAVRAPRSVGAEKRLPPGQDVALRASCAPERRWFLKTKRKTTHFREWFSWWKLTGSNR